MNVGPLGSACNVVGATLKRCLRVPELCSAFRHPQALLEGGTPTVGTGTTRLHLVEVLQ